MSDLIEKIQNLKRHAADMEGENGYQRWIDEIDEIIKSVQVLENLVLERNELDV